MFGQRKRTKARFALGDRVKVLAQEEILEKLESDHLGNNLFMQQMWNYCGNEYNITKVIRNFYHQRMKRSRVPLYMLEDLICDGMISSFTERCDRSCYFLWREDWLENV